MFQVPENQQKTHDTRNPSPTHLQRFLNSEMPSPERMSLNDQTLKNTAVQMANTMHSKSRKADEYKLNAIEEQVDSLQSTVALLMDRTDIFNKEANDIRLAVRDKQA